MKFARAVHATAELAAHLQSGLEALSEAAMSSVNAPEPKQLSGSIDIDVALQRLFPNAPRWDYVIGYRTGKRDDRAYYVEHHPSEVTEVDHVLRKKQWLIDWLRDKALNQIEPRSFVWLSAGSIRIPQNSPAARLISQHGIVLARRLSLR